MLEGPIRAIAIVTTLLVLLSFVFFAADQARKGSEESQAGIANKVTGKDQPTFVKKKSSQPRRFIDGAAAKLESPFDGLVDSGSGPWARKGIPTLLGLLLYGAGLGYLARFSRGRA